MHNLQAMMDGLSAQWQRERSESQMTLGKLIDRLVELPQDALVTLSNPHSYRGHYSDLAFEGDPTTVKEALATCRACMGEVFIGYKGGEYQMGRNTPVWRAAEGCTGMKIVGVNNDATLELAEDV